MGKKDKAMLEKLRAERERLVRQVEALQNEIRGVDRAIGLFSADEAPRQRPKNVKDTVLRIVEQRGPIGATVDEVVKDALDQGIHLEKGTVASNLSRLKADGTFEGREGRYFFRAPPRAEAFVPATVQ
jgi:hypothetical protein